MSDIASLLGIKEDASDGRGGSVTVLFNALGFDVNRDELNEARADFLRVRLRGQLPHEIDPATMSIQSSAAVQDAQALLAGWDPAANDLEPFVLTSEVLSTPGKFELEAGDFTPLRKARIRLAFDYILVCRKYNGQSLPIDNEAYQLILGVLTEQIAQLIALGQLDAEEVDYLPMADVILACRGMTAEIMNTGVDNVSDLIVKLAGTCGIRLDHLDDDDAEEYFDELTSVVLKDGLTMAEMSTNSGFPKTDMLDLSRLLFGIRACTLQPNDAIEEEFKSAVFDAMYCVVGLRRWHHSIPLAVPHDLSPKRSAKVRDAAIEKYLRCLTLYAFVIEALTKVEGRKRVPTILLHLGDVLDKAFDQVSRHNARSLLEGGKPAEELYQLTESAVRAAIDQL